MKDTYVALDMLFLDGCGRVVAIEENAAPLTVTPRGPDCPSLYVLEVSAGWARAHGVAPGVDVRAVGVR